MVAVDYDDDYDDDYDSREGGGVRGVMTEKCVM